MRLLRGRLTWGRCIGGSTLIFGAALGWFVAFVPWKPTIVIDEVMVAPAIRSQSTTLQITTKYDNSGCDQILLVRFLLSSTPSPAIALPQKRGPTVLPADKNMIIESVSIDFVLVRGDWHMFSVATCYVGNAPVTATTVAPVALFRVTEADKKG